MDDSQRNNPEQNTAGSIKEMIQSEIRSSQNAINESTLALEKMRQDVNRLTQRNTDISTHIQQTVEKLESIPRGDIKLAYENALDAQKRYLLTRGQIEKIQNDQERWLHYQDSLIKIDNYLKSGMDTGSGKTAESHGGSIDETIKIEENERARLSKLMHDGPAQALTNFILQIEIAMRASDVDAVQAKEELNALKISSMKVFQRIRNFIFELKPFTLDDQGLIPTLKKYFDGFREQSNIEISLKTNGSERSLGQTIDVILFRSIQELLSNVQSFSQASLVTVQIEYNDRSVDVIVEDNGKGFDIGKLDEGRPGGLNHLKERIEGLGGNMVVESNPDSGTQIKFNLPDKKESVS